MRLYTAEQAAEILQLSKWTVWKYGREGKLKTVKFGRTVRYDLEVQNESHSDNYHSADVHGDRCGNADSYCSKLGGM